MCQFQVHEWRVGIWQSWCACLQEPAPWQAAAGALILLAAKLHRVWLDAGSVCVNTPAAITKAQHQQQTAWQPLDPLASNSHAP